MHTSYHSTVVVPAWSAQSHVAGSLTLGSQRSYLLYISCSNWNPMKIYHCTWSWGAFLQNCNHRCEWQTQRCCTTPHSIKRNLVSQDLRIFKSDANQYVERLNCSLQPCCVKFLVLEHLRRPSWFDPSSCSWGEVRNVWSERVGDDGIKVRVQDPVSHDTAAIA